MKNYILILVLLSLITVTKAQVPDWSPNPQAFSNSMVVVGVVNVGGLESVDQTDIIGAFVNGEVRGVASPVYDADADRYIAYMIIYGDVENESVTYQVYDKSADSILDILDTSSFEINGILGTIFQPHVWADTVLSSEANLISLSLLTLPSTVIITDSTVDISHTIEADLSQILMSFVVSENATFFINGKIQSNQFVFVDFTAPIEILVKSQDQSVLSVFKVNISFVKVLAIGDVAPDDFVLYPNPIERNANFSLSNSYIGIVEANLIDIEGKKVKAFSYNKTQTQFDSKLDIGELPAGIYFLNILGEGMNYKSKVIKK